MKSCGTCKRCCDGTYMGNIKGHVMGNGRPCHFLGKNGCTIYDSRPEKPCREFECLWLEFDEVPDYMKPEVAGAIVNARSLDDGTRYLVIEGHESEYSAQVFFYTVEFAEKNNMSLVYRRNGQVSLMGDPAVCAKIIEKLKQEELDFIKQNQI